MSVHAFLVYCAIYAVTIAVPGPGVIAIIARALSVGYRRTIPAIIGMAAGDLTYMSLSVFGLAVLAQAMGGLFLIVKLAGAAYLLWLGWQYWRAPARNFALPQAESAARGFLAQYLVTMGNPKAMAVFLAILPAAVDLHHVTAGGYLMLVCATLVLIPAILSVYAAMAARLRAALTTAKAQKRLNRSAALIMAGAGIGVATTTS